eukprot:15342519-Ditylum_brightwellii.AAC.1
MHWDHDIGEECGGGDMREAMVPKKVSTWAPTKGTNYCPLKPRQCLQRADAYPSTQTKDDLCVLTWGGGAYDDTAVFVAVVVTVIWGEMM